MDKAAKELMKLDRAFCLESKKRKEKGWQKYLSKNALLGSGLHEPYVEGRQKITKIIEIIYSLNNIDFDWQPQHAFMSNDGTLGVTTGIYTRTYNLNNEAIEEIGKYMTVWQKEDDTYKIVFDMGN